MICLVFWLKCLLSHIFLLHTSRSIPSVRQASSHAWEYFNSLSDLWTKTGRKLHIAASSAMYFSIFILSYYALVNYCTSQLHHWKGKVSPTNYDLFIMYISIILHVGLLYYLHNNTSKFDRKVKGFSILICSMQYTVALKKWIWIYIHQSVFWHKFVVNLTKKKNSPVSEDCYGKFKSSSLIWMNKLQQLPLWNRLLHDVPTLRLTSVIFCMRIYNIIRRPFLSSSTRHCVEFLNEDWRYGSHL